MNSARSALETRLRRSTMSTGASARAASAARPLHVPSAAELWGLLGAIQAFEPGIFDKVARHLHAWVFQRAVLCYHAGDVRHMSWPSSHTLTITDHPPPAPALALRQARLALLLTDLLPRGRSRDQVCHCLSWLLARAARYVPMATPGLRVKLGGIKSAAALNGRAGTVHGPAVPPKQGRVAVLLDGDARPKSLSENNLRKLLDVRPATVHSGACEERHARGRADVCRCDDATTHDAGCACLLCEATRAGCGSPRHLRACAWCPGNDDDDDDDDDNPAVLCGCGAPACPNSTQSWSTYSCDGIGSFAKPCGFWACSECQDNEPAAWFVCVECGRAECEGCNEQLSCDICSGGATFCLLCVRSTSRVKVRLTHPLREETVEVFCTASNVLLQSSDTFSRVCYKCAGQLSVAELECGAMLDDTEARVLKSAAGSSDVTALVKVRTPKTLSPPPHYARLRRQNVAQIHCHELEGRGHGLLVKMILRPGKKRTEP